MLEYLEWLIVGLSVTTLGVPSLSPTIMSCTYVMAFPQLCDGPFPAPRNILNPHNSAKPQKILNQSNIPNT